MEIIPNQMSFFSNRNQLRNCQNLKFFSSGSYLATGLQPIGMVHELAKILWGALINPVWRYVELAIESFTFK